MYVTMVGHIVFKQEPTAANGIHGHTMIPKNEAPWWRSSRRCMANLLDG